MGRESRVFREGFKLQGGLHMKKSLTLAASAAALVTLSVGAYAAANWYPYKIEVWEKAFDMASARHMMEYTPLEKASQKWKICVSFPHMKDDYWLAVDYGAIDEAKRMGVKMQVLEAGGYTELNKQTQPDRELRRRRRPGGHHRRDLVRRPEQPGRPARRQEDPGHRRDQRHLLRQAVGQVAGLVRRDGRQGRRIPGQAASEGRRRRRRSRGSPDRRAPAGWRRAIPASPRR